MLLHTGRDTDCPICAGLQLAPHMNGFQRRHNKSLLANFQVFAQTTSIVLSTTDPYSCMPTRTSLSVTIEHAFMCSLCTPNFAGESHCSKSVLTASGTTIPLYCPLSRSAVSETVNPDSRDLASWRQQHVSPCCSCTTLSHGCRLCSTETGRTGHSNLL